MHVRFVWSWALLVAFLLRPDSAAGGEFVELLRRVPSEANAVVLIDATRLFSSPIAQRGGWKKKQLAEYAERPMAVPPQATKVVRAGHIDFQSREALWSVALIELPNAPSLDKIAGREKGYVEKVANTKAVWSPRGTYVVSIGGGDALGLLFPPNRQFLSRWLKQPQGRIEPYLLQATQSMSVTDAQVLLAIDLEDAVKPDAARKLIDAVGINTQSAGVEEMVRAIESLHGAKLEIVLKDKAWGRLMLDFLDDPAALVPLAKPMVVETLARAGWAVDDIQSWTVEHKAKSISLHGELSTGGLLRLGSLFELPSLDLDSSDETVDASKPAVYATQNHFKAVDKLLHDLMAEKRDAKTLGQVAGWCEQYAKRIDRLPLLNVDADMQTYSANVADDLRQIAFSIKGVGIRTGAQAGSYDDTWSPGYGAYDGYYGSRTADAQRRAIRAQERATGATDSSKIADQIRADTSKIRRLMTERYKVEF